MELDLKIYDVFELLKASYKNIDFRSAIYNKDNYQRRILSVIRFSNESESMLNKKYEKLDLKRYKTKSFELHHDILEIPKWEDKLIELYEEIEDIEIDDVDEFYYHDNEYYEFQSTFLDEFKVNFSTPKFRFFFTEEEIQKYNVINFYYSVSNKNEHHNQFNKFLKKEILILGEDNIYDVINRTMQLDGYSSQNGLYISVLFPIYMKLNNLNYSEEILSGKVQFHDIFDKTKIFFRIYSDPNYKDKSYEGGEQFVISKDAPDIRGIDKGIFETTFNLDFRQYDCDPIFEIRALWENLKELYLIDFRHTFDTPRFQKAYENLIKEESEDIVEVDKDDLKFHYIIDPEIYLENDYMEVANEINIAYEKRFFNCVYILVRKLLENLLIDCLRRYYTMGEIDKFFDQNRRKFLPFSILRLRFNEMIEETKFIASVGEIQHQIIDYLEIFREIGNSSAHSFFSVNHQLIIESNRNKLSIVLKQLVKILNKLPLG